MRSMASFALPRILACRKDGTRVPDRQDFDRAEARHNAFEQNKVKQILIAAPTATDIPFRFTSRRPFEFVEATADCQDQPKVSHRQGFRDPYKDPIPVERHILRCRRLRCHVNPPRLVNREAGSKNQWVDPEID